jgi:hypothetical protein
VGVRRRLSTVADVAVTVAVSRTTDPHAVDPSRPARWFDGRTVHDWKTRRMSSPWLRRRLG